MCFTLLREASVLVDCCQNKARLSLISAACLFVRMFGTWFVPKRTINHLKLRADVELEFI